MFAAGIALESVMKLFTTGTTSQKLHDHTHQSKIRNGRSKSLKGIETGILALGLHFVGQILYSMSIGFQH